MRTIMINNDDDDDGDDDDDDKWSPSETASKSSTQTSTSDHRILRKYPYKDWLIVINREIFELPTSELPTGRQSWGMQF